MRKKKYIYIYNCQEYFTRESGYTDYLKENQWTWKVEWLTSNCHCKSLIEQQHQKNQQGNKRLKLYRES